MKGGIRAGFRHLKENEFNQALNSFKARLKTASTPEEINTCLYGKARAQIGLHNYDVAVRILEQLFVSAPQWEVPYISLARMYEERNMLKQAEATYLRAVNDKKERSKKFYRCYEWFLRQRMLPFMQERQLIAQPALQPLQQQRTFSPGLQLHQQQYRANNKPAASSQQEQSDKKQMIRK